MASRVSFARARRHVPVDATPPPRPGAMAVAADTYMEKTDEQQAITEMVRQFVDNEIIPVAGEYDHEQKDHFLPKMATGEIRAAFSLSEPEVGSDVQGIKATAKRADDGYWELNGQKMWVTNGLLSGVVFVLIKTDTKADPPYKGMTCFICEKEPGADQVPGLTIPPKIKKMGYKGVESTELVFDGFKVSDDGILGGPEGLGDGFV